MALTKKNWLLIGLGLSSLAFLFHILTHGLAKWGIVSSRSGKSAETIGLWSVCLVGDGQSFCLSLTCDVYNLSSSKCTILILTRAFWIVTTIICGITVIVFILKLIPNLSLNQRLSNILLNLPIACVITGILGIILGFVFVLQDTKYSVDACLFLAIFAYILQLVIVFIIRHIKKDECE